MSSNLRTHIMQIIGTSLFIDSAEKTGQQQHLAHAYVLFLMHCLQAQIKSRAVFGELKPFCCTSMATNCQVPHMGHRFD